MHNIGWIVLVWSIRWICVWSLDNGLARTPPMGWLSWTRFMCQTDCTRDLNNCISEKLFIDMAEHMVKDGYRDAGYVYVNLDDCWSSKQRTKHGKLQADPQRFPHGIKWLADYMHDRGLKMGIYANYGKLTCMGYPGSIDHMDEDARTFAGWGADYLKFDGCFTKPDKMDEDYPRMQQYLNRTGRDFVYSCSWPYYLLTAQIRQEPNYELIAKHCNLWRNFDDIQIKWDSVLRIIDYYDHHQDELSKYHGPGHWNDPDMLIIGNPGLTADQARVQMALWCIWSAPLLMSNDLRDIRPEFREILINRKLIQIDQDPLGVMGKKIREEGSISVYKKPILPVDRTQKYFSYAIAIFNRDVSSMKYYDVKLSDFGLNYPFGYEVEDLFANRQLGVVQMGEVNKVQIPPTGVVMWRAVIVSPSDQETEEDDIDRKPKYRPSSTEFMSITDPRWMLFGGLVFILVLFWWKRMRLRELKVRFLRWKRL